MIRLYRRGMILKLYVVLLSGSAQLSFHDAPIFRLLLKIAVF